MKMYGNFSKNDLSLKVDLVLLQLHRYLTKIIFLLFNDTFLCNEKSLYTIVNIIIIELILC